MNEEFELKSVLHRRISLGFNLRLAVKITCLDYINFCVKEVCVSHLHRKRIEDINKHFEVETGVYRRL